ncbi:hypothetical protein [Haladaptatus sp. DYF46]|uniref:hypothetical protein n=1 Tax=Haladaptatus sp. DYF46 TaxID=2886041 RepID=UPI001E5D7717|nr:hypothetical protein [Haladaptatus sp. DYF46]
MRKTLKILLAMTVVGSLFALGFAGNAAAYAEDNQVQINGQAAVSDVHQDQAVLQGNYNEQDDNVAISGALNANFRDSADGSGAESGNAVAIQASAQSNDNAQVAYSNAQNVNWQSQDD